MPKSTLTWYKAKAKRILMDLKLIKQKDLAAELNTSQQNISYAFTSCEWQRQLENWLRILRIAGYEIVRKEDEEMKAETLKLSEIPYRHQKYSDFYKLIDDFVESGEEVLRLQCDSREECKRIYARIYAATVRRHNYPIERLIRGNDLYIINSSAVGIKNAKANN